MVSWAPWVSLGLNVLILVVSVSGFIKIMKNDLFHVQKALEEIKVGLTKLSEEVNHNAERVAVIEGRCAANHK